MERTPEDRKDDTLSADAAAEKYAPEIAYETPGDAEYRINDYYTKKSKKLADLKWDATGISGFDMNKIVATLKAGKDAEKGSEEELAAIRIREDLGNASWFPMAEAFLKAEDDLVARKAEVKEVRREMNSEKDRKERAKKQAEIMSKLKGLGL